MAESAELPLISVVMPCFNAERYVREAVESVLGQSYPRVELIVVDDGSTDRSRAVLESYGARIRVLAQSNRGPYRARNLGGSHATGEYIAFLDADDWWSPECMEKLALALATNRAAALAYCGWQNVDAQDRSNDPYLPPEYENTGKVELLLRGGSPWPIHAALTRRAVLEEIGWFRTDLATSLDFELWLRIASTQTIVFVPEVLAFYRFHGHGQISAFPWRQALNGWIIKRRFLAENPAISSSLSRERVRELTDGALLRRGYQFYWRRDLVSAHRVFRRVWLTQGWTLKDVRYLLPALLPEYLYSAFVGCVDRLR